MNKRQRENLVSEIVIMKKAGVSMTMCNNRKCRKLCARNSRNGEKDLTDMVVLHGQEYCNNFVKATGFCNDDMDTTIKRLKKNIEHERNNREALKNIGVIL